MRDMLVKSNSVVVDYAKQMIGVSFAAIGVVTALADLGGYMYVALAATLCLVYLVAAGLFLRVLFPRPSDITQYGYSDAADRIQRLAAARRRMAVAATWVTVIATISAVGFFAFTPTIS